MKFFCGSHGQEWFILLVGGRHFLVRIEGLRFNGRCAAVSAVPNARAPRNRQRQWWDIPFERYEVGDGALLYLTPWVLYLSY